MRKFSHLVLCLLSVCALNGQNADREIRARVVSPTGQPVTNATVIVHAVARATGTRYAGNEDVDASAKSDAIGLFVLRGKNPFLAATMTIEAPGFARTVFSEVPTADEVQHLPLLSGATVKGALKKDGLPVRGVTMGICDVEADSKIFAMDLRATTDENGGFEVRNVPSKRQFFLFGTTQSLAGKGAVPSRRVVTGAEGSTLDLGDIAVEASYRVEGQLKGATGNARITLARWGARDSAVTKPDAEGRFKFTDVPAEVISVSASIPSHRLTLRNASLNPANPVELVGRITTNKLDLMVELEPGPSLQPLNISAAAARNESLRGIEAPQGDIQVSGTVVDAKTGAPLSAFVTSEGRVKEGGSYDWLFTRQQVQTNSAFKTFLQSGELPPILVIQATNYIPWVSAPITGSTNLTIKLQLGIQPKGSVLRPDGQPATNVTVYLADGFTTTVFEGLSVTHNSSARVVTDGQGRFSFPAQADAMSLLVFDKAGFAEPSIAEVQRTGKIQLQPLWRVEGKLLIGNTPGTNELIRVVTSPPPYHWYPRELPAYSIAFATRTDEAGNFAVEHLPPTMIEVAHSPAIGSAPPLGGFPMTQSQRLFPAPGKTERIRLGGAGRPVIGRIEVSGFDAPIDWRGSIQSMENVVKNEGPSEAALKSLLEKLRAIPLSGATLAQRDTAEAAYQAERKLLAADTQKYFVSDKGRSALLAAHRYFLQFSSDGAFRVEDLPPGKYIITMRILNADPAAINTRRWVVADLQTEVTIPEGSDPFDLGTITAKTRGNR